MRNFLKKNKLQLNKMLIAPAENQTRDGLGLISKRLSFSLILSSLIMVLSSFVVEASTEHPFIHYNKYDFRQH